MNTIEKLNRDACCGCSACYSICPNHCITMKKNSEGFYYPYVNKDKCTNCGFCSKVCPILSKPKNNNIPECYIMRCRDLITLKDSTSGGMYTPLSENIISQGGVSFGVKIDDNFNVVHDYASCVEDVVKFRGSKYVQSNVGDSFRLVKKHLLNGQKVIFSGTPCQVAGLKNYLGKEYQTLYCIDLVCRGGASPKVFEKYIEYLEKKFHSKISNIKFRKKVYGYHSSAMQIDFTNKKKYISSGRTDYMLISFFSGLCSRKSCYQCQFRDERRVSDLTLFDAWHYTQLTKGQHDDDKGYTIVLVHSQKGKQLIDSISDKLIIQKVDLDKAIDYDGIMLRSQPECNTNRDKFMNIVENENLETAIKKTVGVSILSRIIEKSRATLYYLGILKLIKKIKCRR